MIFILRRLISAILIIGIKVYDIFFISDKYINQRAWKDFKRRFPYSRMIENVKNINQIKEKSFTNFFWVVWDNVLVLDSFDFRYEVPEWDMSYIHMWKNQCGDSAEYINGVCLIPKDSEISDRELKSRFFFNKKEIDQVASKFQYPIFEITDYDHYMDIVNTEHEPLFWVKWNDIEITAESIFDLYWNPRDGKYDYDRSENHVFKNSDYYDGLWLLSTSKKISKKEFESRFLVDKKEWDRVVSEPITFERFEINDYDDYMMAVEKSKTQMFWAIWNDIDICDDFDFRYYVPAYDVFHRNITHVFKNGESFDGLCLFSKTTPVTKKEIYNRYFVDKKEVDIKASTPKRYEKFIVDNYEDYLRAKTDSKFDMFWLIPREVEILPSFDFDMYFPHYEREEKQLNHVFKHQFRDQENYTGISLLPKTGRLSEREIRYRFFIDKKQHDTLASCVAPYDIVFISYNEINADENYKQLLEKFPRAKRVHGIKGIHNAHIAAAKEVNTEMFWVVDGDAVIIDGFNFDHEVSRYETDIVHVWRSKNPVNDLVYGYGGVKLLPTTMTISMDLSKPDMTTSISNKFKAVKALSNITKFNTDEFSTWRSAFRECCKLASQIIDRQKNQETLERLDVWCKVGLEREFGQYAIEGAKAGRTYGEENKGDIEKLKMINDFDWLSGRYVSAYGK